jgi:diguanylate cyclase (GGDEF)-like protein
VAPPAQRVQAEKLASVLAEFAERLVQGFQVQEILDHLVLRIVDVLPVTGAGVMLMGAAGELHFAAASNEMILEIETLQNELGEGPCLEAYRVGEAISIPDLAADARFPRFSKRARQAGMAAVFTFPMSINGRRFGALDLYRDSTGSLDGPASEAAEVLANVAAAYLHYAHDRAASADDLDIMRQRSLHDALTGLPNRTLLRERLEQAVARASRSKKLVAVLFIDLDRFKTVNDAHGHQVGDQVLIEVATRLTAVLRAGETVARLSGDEFVVVCEDHDHPDQARSIAEKITTALADVFRLGGELVPVGASIGVAFCGPGTAASPESLLRDADLAMYQAKESGGGRHRLVDENAREAARRRTELIRDLKEALRDDHLQLAYQPIVAVAGGDLEGVEALLRWHHPVLGWVSPELAVRAAEESGLILPLGEWVLTRACHDFQRWREEYGSAVPHVTVNVSPLQMMAPGFELTIERALDAADMDPADLFLEITEHIFLDDGPRALSVLEHLRTLGIGIILDDFGTGYASLSYLRRFPFEILKIDRDFIADLTTDRQTRTIVTAIIELAHGLDLTVVAEGVETREQYAELDRLGADRAQGYDLCRPLLVEQFDHSLLDTATSFPLHLPIAGHRETHHDGATTTAARRIPRQDVDTGRE